MTLVDMWSHKMLHSTICWCQQWTLETACPTILPLIWNLKRWHSTHLSSTGFVEFCIDSLYKLKENERDTHTQRIRCVLKDIWKSYRDEIWAGGPYSKEKRESWISFVPVQGSAHFKLLHGPYFLASI